MLAVIRADDPAALAAKVEHARNTTTRRVVCAYGAREAEEAEKWDEEMGGGGGGGRAQVAAGRENSGGWAKAVGCLKRRDGSRGTVM